MVKTLDMRKNPCPIPMIQARRALEAPDVFAVVVWVDNEIAVQNLEKMATGLGYGFSSEPLGELHWGVRIWKIGTEGLENEGGDAREGEGGAPSGPSEGASSADLPEHAPAARDLGQDSDKRYPASPLTPLGDSCAATILISSDQLGRGSEELGRILIKGFVFALTALPIPPKTLLFMNAGVQLVAQGSGVLSDLKKLEQKGVNILACGTCLNYYSLTDKLAVGQITDMYDIASRLAAADRLISL